MSQSITSATEMESLVLTAQAHLKDIIHVVYNHSDQERAVVVYDTNCLLSTVLTQAYRHALPHATFLDFSQLQPETILETLNMLQASDFVVLVQSTNFRLDAFRIRVELFKRKIKVIEHPHLSRIADRDARYYIDALAYDPDYYRVVGPALKRKIDSAPSGVVDSGGALLYYDTPFESAKLNIGDYRAMPNTGGQFPIGEVFTEAKTLTALHGRLRIFLFSDTSYTINRPTEPITLIIEEGKVVDTENSTPAFDEILTMIREDEGVVWVRELGFGLNRAFSKERTVSDTGSFERMCGVHVSLGAKHGMYGKPGFKRRDGKYHVDVFADTKSVTLGDEVVFKNSAWIV